MATTTVLGVARRCVGGWGRCRATTGSVCAAASSPVARVSAHGVGWQGVRTLGSVPQKYPCSVSASCAHMQQRAGPLHAGGGGALRSGISALPSVAQPPLVKRTLNITTGKGLKTTWMMRFMQFLNRASWVKDYRRLEWFPPFLIMRAKVFKLENNWRTVHMRLPLNTLSRNPGGVMFGGYQVALADPIPAMACARIFPEYSSWTRGMSIDFLRGGSTTLELRFEFPPELEQQIRDELKEKGRATPTFHYSFHLASGETCSRVTNTVAIRPKGYLKASTPPASPDGL